MHAHHPAKDGDSLRRIAHIPPAHASPHHPILASPSARSPPARPRSQARASSRPRSSPLTAAIGSPDALRVLRDPRDPAQHSRFPRRDIPSHATCRGAERARSQARTSIPASIAPAGHHADSSLYPAISQMHPSCPIRPA
ncbi:hypothetical protein VTO73DRAFT_14708 [Trametes versicolor]